MFRRKHANGPNADMPHETQRADVVNRRAPTKVGNLAAARIPPPMRWDFMPSPGVGRSRADPRGENFALALEQRAQTLQGVVKPSALGHFVDAFQP